MPQPLTEEQARSKTCPFMSYRSPSETRSICEGSDCACWSWIEEYGPSTGTILEERDTRDHPKRPGDEWGFEERWDSNGRKERNVWALHERGPRRGRCEAGGSL